MQNQVQIDFDNENDDFCDENGNSFDDYGDENDQKTDKYHGFLVKYTPFKHYYLVKKKAKTTRQGSTPPPPYGQCPFKIIFFLLDVVPK